MAHNLRQIFGDTWEDFLSLPISESGRRKFEENPKWGINYKICDNVPYVIAFGYQGYGEWAADILTYDGKEVKVEDAIVPDAVYSIEGRSFNITDEYAQQGEDFWKYNP